MQRSASIKVTAAKIALTAASKGSDGEDETTAHIAGAIALPQGKPRQDRPSAANTNSTDNAGTGTVRGGSLRENNVNGIAIDKRQALPQGTGRGNEVHAINSVHPILNRPFARHAPPTSPPSIESPRIFRAISNSSTFAQPIPIPSTRSRAGSYASSVATLEATAERFLLADSIDDAIRDAHEELKRDDSRRSSLLSISTISRAGSTAARSPRQQLSSSQGLRSSRYMMSPTFSSGSGELHSASGSKPTGVASRTSSTESRPPTANGDSLPMLAHSRSWNGSSDGTRDAYSSGPGSAQLPNIDESEPPMDSKELGPTDGDESFNNEHIVSDMTDAMAAHTQDHGQAVPMKVHPETMSAENLATAPPSTTDTALDGGITDGVSRQPSNAHSILTNGNHAFTDFDGVHCDPDSVAEQFPFEATQAEELVAKTTTARRRPRLAERPQSYFDPGTGQDMLYYPAPVPSMLRLPQKLGKGMTNAQRVARRDKLLSQMPLVAQERGLLGVRSVQGNDSMYRQDASLHQSNEAQSPVTGSVKSGGNGNVDSTAPLEAPAELQHLRKPPSLRAVNTSRPKSNLSSIPPQLRAGAFFDLPSESPHVELKNGSATATLDDILDAAAYAPVNAFTDHVFAGHLGAEVYGYQGKHNVHSTVATKRQGKTTSEAPLSVVDKRKSVWSLLPGKLRPKTSSNMLASVDRSQRSRLSSSIRGELSSSEGEDDESSFLAPDADEGDSTSDADGEDAQPYSGAPTTLLAELQLRKQEQKRRTAPIHEAYPDGIHSTLLEMDAVAQLQAKTRQDKKVALAWDDEPEDEYADDEDVPLGLIAARKRLNLPADAHVGVTDNSIRPMGLIEKRDIEDNEPLRSRRDRLQGREPPRQSLYLNAGAGNSRLSMMPSSTMRTAGRSSMREPSPRLSTYDGSALPELATPEEHDNGLPHARPVSRAFSDELLGQFTTEDKGKAVDRGTKTPVPEEEETLGQRRKRLQAERKMQGGIRQVSNDSSDSVVARRRSSMADLLRSNPVEPAKGLVDPRKNATSLHQQQQEQNRLAWSNGRLGSGQYSGGGVVPQGTGMYGPAGLTSPAGMPPAMGFMPQQFPGQMMPMMNGANMGYGPMVGYGMPMPMPVPMPNTLQTGMPGFGYPQMPHMMGMGFGPQMGTGMGMGMGMNMGMRLPNGQLPKGAESYRNGGLSRG